VNTGKLLFARLMDFLPWTSQSPIFPGSSPISYNRTRTGYPISTELPASDQQDGNEWRDLSSEACNWPGPDRMKRNSICSLGVGITPRFYDRAKVACSIGVVSTNPFARLSVETAQLLSREGTGLLRYQDELESPDSIELQVCGF
jgi:hypothetical protein